MQQNPCRNGGFALTEVLVAATLLAVGLIGQLALLVAGLRAERAAAELATAATLASDLGERIRANRGAAQLYVVAPEAAAPAAVNCALATPADAVARAACDLDEWRSEADAVLPRVELQLNATGVAGSSATLCSITLRWQGARTERLEYTLWVQV